MFFWIKRKFCIESIQVSFNRKSQMNWQNSVCGGENVERKGTRLKKRLSFDIDRAWLTSFWGGNSSVFQARFLRGGVAWFDFDASIGRRWSSFALSIPLGSTSSATLSLPIPRSTCPLKLRFRARRVLAILLQPGRGFVSLSIEFPILYRANHFECLLREF